MKERKELREGRKRKTTIDAADSSSLASEHRVLFVADQLRDNHLKKVVLDAGKLVAASLALEGGGCFSVRSPGDIQRDLGWVKGLGLGIQLQLVGVFISSLGDVGVWNVFILRCLRRLVSAWTSLSDPMGGAIWPESRVCGYPSKVDYGFFFLGRIA